MGKTGFPQRPVTSQSIPLCVYKYHFADPVHHVFLWIRPLRKVQTARHSKYVRKSAKCHKKQAKNLQFNIYNKLYRDHLKTTGGYAFHYAFESAFAKEDYCLA
jgi:hypothetical protein